MTIARLLLFPWRWLWWELGNLWCVWCTCRDGRNDTKHIDVEA